MAVSWQLAQIHTEAKYPAAKVRVESMVFSDLVDSINDAYNDHDFLALQYLGTCLSSSVFGRLKGSSAISKDLPKTLARLLRDINSAHRKEDFKAMHHLGNRLATASVFEHAGQHCVRENSVVNERIIENRVRSCIVRKKLQFARQVSPELC